MNVINIYIWTINVIRSRKNGLTIEELDNEWHDCDLNVNHSQLNVRTFHRWKQAISDKLGIDIVCNPSKGYKYSIENIDEATEDKLTSWMLHTITVSNVIEEYKSEKDKVLIDNVPSGDKYLLPILQSIKKGTQISIIYHSIRNDEPNPEQIANPLCVRLYNRRWYAVVDFVENPRRRILSLDSIIGLKQTEHKYSYPKDFDGAEYFAVDYGVGVGFEGEPCYIKLKVKSAQRPYLERLPLHHSQSETIEETDEYAVYEYFLKPSPDFARAILPWGKNIEVIEPLSFSEMVRDMAWEVYNNNK